MPEHSADQCPYFLFTRTPLHVGAGQSVGYIDLPIQREAHTRIPIVPGSGLKGVLRDHPELKPDADMLFGKATSDGESQSYAGTLLIGEARVLAFPVRSAKGCFAWITCPLMLSRYSRDVTIDNFPSAKGLDTVQEGEDGSVTVLAGTKVTEKKKVVLEEYTFTAAPPAQDDVRAKWEEHLLKILQNERVWQLLKDRLVIVPDGIFSFFVQSACEVAQHVAIDDDTGTAKARALFNQENCPAETLFYGMMAGQKINGHNPAGSLSKLRALDGKAIQLGGNETTGLGWCTFTLNYPKGG